MQNPLLEKDTAKSFKLVKAALNGDRVALDELVKIHQPFIYNVAWKMCHDPDDAKDLTQEVLIKVITKLSQFSFKSSFNTWLYRIVFNEFLQSKRKGKKPFFKSFEAYGDVLDSLPNPELNREEEIENAEISKELNISCMSGMLMCLTNEQRLIYIVGDTFGVDHNLGAELFNVSSQNFRIKLHRARKELYNFMNSKCGLVKKENPCRCPKKAKGLKEKGLLDSNTMTFNIATTKKYRDYAAANHDKAMDIIDTQYTELYRNHPFRENFGKETIVSELLENKDLMKILNIE